MTAADRSEHDDDCVCEACWPTTLAATLDDLDAADGWDDDEHADDCVCADCFEAWT